MPLASRVALALFWLMIIATSFTTRLRNPVWLVFAMTGSGLLGYLGLIVDPRTLPWLWPCLLAVAGSCFPMILVLLGMRTRTPAGTAALSSFAQSAGYVLASFGPFLFGAVKDATGNYLGPLWIEKAYQYEGQGLGGKKACGNNGGRRGVPEDREVAADTAAAMGYCRWLGRGYDVGRICC